jgi:hypothetical protein
MPAYFVFHNRIKDPAMMAEYIGKAFASLAPYNMSSFSSPMKTARS